MACCAFAVFLLSQLLLPLAKLREWLFGAPAAKADKAASWRPGMPGMEGAAMAGSLPRFRRFGKALAVTACLELALITGLALGGMSLPALSSTSGEPAQASGVFADIEIIHTSICSKLGFRP